MYLSKVHSVLQVLQISLYYLDMGTILVNGRELDLSFDFGGMYYPELTVTVTAVPADGYKFTGWKVKKGDIADTSSETLSFNVSGTTTLQAIFEKE